MAAGHVAPGAVDGARRARTPRCRAARGALPSRAAPRARRRSGRAASSSAARSAGGIRTSASVRSSRGTWASREIGAVEASRQLLQGDVAPHPHVGHDGGDHGFEVVSCRGRSGELGSQVACNVTDVATSEHGNSSSYRPGPRRRLGRNRPVAHCRDERRERPCLAVEPGAQVDELAARVTELAERYGVTPDSAVASRSVRRRACTRYGPPHAGARRQAADLPRRRVIAAQAIAAGAPLSSGGPWGSGRPSRPTGRCRPGCKRRSAACGRRTPCGRARSAATRDRPTPRAATIAPRSCSIFTGSVSAVSRSRPESRVTCVSTGSPGSRNHTERTTLPVLRPDARQRRRGRRARRGISPSKRSTTACAMPTRFFALAWKKPVDWMSDSSSVEVGRGQVGRGRVLREDRGCHHVDALVGALRRQDRRDEQLVRVRCAPSAQCASG